MSERKELIKSASVEVQENSLRFIASKEVVDRDGDIIFIDGIDTANFMKNPVFLKSHDAGEYPIGKVTAINKTAGADGVKQMEITVEFADTEEGKTAKYLFDGGFMNAVSIRAGIREYQDVNLPDRKGWDILKSELYEVSAVTIPANQEAMIIKGLKAIEKQEKQTEFEKNAIERIDALAKLCGIQNGTGQSKTETIYQKLFELADKQKQLRKEAANG